MPGVGGFAARGTTLWHGMALPLARVTIKREKEKDLRAVTAQYSTSIDTNSERRKAFGSGLGVAAQYQSWRWFAAAYPRNDPFRASTANRFADQLEPHRSKVQFTSKLDLARCIDLGWHG